MGRKAPAKKKQKLNENAPKPLPSHFPHAFHGLHGDNFHYPLSRNEMITYQLCSEIKRKPKWTEKINDKKIVEKWRKEAIESYTDEYHVPEWAYGTDSREDGAGNCFDNAIITLRNEAQKENGPIQISSVRGVYQADDLIPADVKSALLKSVAKLEQGPKDWHPGSNEQVLDLVHPSMYCLVNGVSLVTKEPLSFPGLNQMGGGEPVSFEMREEDVDVEQEGMYSNEYTGEDETPNGSLTNEYTFSKKYQWLPAEFNVSLDGTTKVESYINNLHPVEYREMYGTLEKIFSKFVPMFNGVLSEITLHEVDLKGHKLQVIVKLANIVLTPKNPKYNGGSWHVEGMLNERIVASGIYYYDNDNVAESHLDFRVAVCQPSDRDKDEYGYYYDQELNQSRGYVVTQADRCIAFPNTMQHHVSSFELVNNKLPGHRKILVFFLVDPSTRVTSTLNVPPQQRSWYAPVLLKQRAMRFLPDEVVSLIVEYLDYPMTEEDAQKYRQELMDERKYFIKENSTSVFERPCSLCEH